MARKSGLIVPRLAGLLVVWLAVAPAFVTGCSSPVESGDDAGAAASSDRLNALVIVLDATDADRVSHVGYSRETTPNIDALAKRGVAFTAAFSQTSNTLSSTRSYLTGRYLPQPADGRFRYAIQDRDHTLAEAFHDAGYATAAYADNPYIAKRLGFDAGFEEHVHVLGRDAWVRYGTDEGPPDPTAGLVEQATTWIQGQKDRPWFCYLHLLRPHDPYFSPEPWLSKFTDRGFPITEMTDRQGNPMPLSRLLRLKGKSGDFTPAETQYLIDLYDGNLAYIDHVIGEMIDALAASGDLDRTVIVVTSDHGEAFMQHGTIGHNDHVYDEMIHVPLVFAGPESAGFTTSAFSEPVEMVDLFPTFRDLFGLTPQRELHGQSLLPALRGEPWTPKPYVFSHTNDLLLFGVRSAERKVIFRRDTLTELPEPVETYDLRVDAAEQENRIDDVDVSAFVDAAMKYAAQYWTTADEVSQDIPSDVIEQLEALGYLGGDEPDSATQE